MMKKILIATALFALCGQAGAWDFKGNNRADFWLSQPGYSLAYKEVLDLSLRGSLKNDIGLSAGIRYTQDEELWNDTTTYRGVSKKFVEISRGDLSLQLGNYYASLGRGLILNCLNDERVKLDRDMEGGCLKTSYGGLLEGKGVIGRAFENTTPLNGGTLLGGQVVFNPWEIVDIGGIYLRTNASDRTDDVNYNKPAQESFGGTLGWRLSDFEYYGEYAQRHTYGILDPTLGWVGIEDEAGKGFYSSLSWAVSGIGMTLDYKDYKGMNSPVNAPPPCNREGRLLNQGYDEQGYQFDIMASPIERIEVHFNYSKADADLNGAGWEDTFAESRWQLSRRWSMQAEARARTEDSLESEVIVRKYKGAGAGVKWVYGERRSLELKLDGDRFRNRYLSGPLEFSELRAQASWRPAGWISLYGGIEYSDKRQPEYDNQERWGRAGAVIEIGKDQKVEISAGQDKGGLVCSGGFCRYEPPFRGIKTSWAWVF